MPVEHTPRHRLAPVFADGGSLVLTDHYSRSANVGVPRSSNRSESRYHRDERQEVTAQSRRGYMQASTPTYAAIRGSTPTTKTAGRRETTVHAQESRRSRDLPNVRSEYTSTKDRHGPKDDDSDTAGFLGASRGDNQTQLQRRGSNRPPYRDDNGSDTYTSRPSATNKRSSGSSLHQFEDESDLDRRSYQVPKTSRHRDSYDDRRKDSRLYVVERKPHSSTQHVRAQTFDNDSSAPRRHDACKHYQQESASARSRHKETSTGYGLTRRSTDRADTILTKGKDRPPSPQVRNRHAVAPAVYREPARDNAPSSTQSKKDSDRYARSPPRHGGRSERHPMKRVGARSDSGSDSDVPGGRYGVARADQYVRTAPSRTAEQASRSARHADADDTRHIREGMERLGRHQTHPVQQRVGRVLFGKKPKDDDSDDTSGIVGARDRPPPRDRYDRTGSDDDEDSSGTLGGRHLPPIRR